jgi:hypothetical protein
MSSKLSEFVPEVKKALDEGMAEFLVVTQGKLAAKNPKDTGRMASSWYIGRDTPDRSVRPEGWAKSGAKRVESPDPPGEIEYDGTWYISNNLPYAERVALDPTYAKGGAGGAAWYNNVVTRLDTNLRRTMGKHLRRI